MRHVSIVFAEQCLQVIKLEKPILLVLACERRRWMLTPSFISKFARINARLLLESKRTTIGDNVMIVAGSPPGIPGSTNAMRVHRMGDAVGGVAPAYR